MSQQRPYSANNSAVSATGGNQVREFIPVTDADQDGLPDWQNSFNIATVYMDDSEDEVVTKTGALAVQLATLTNTTDRDTSSILSQIGGSLSQDLLDEDYRLADIKVSQDNSQSALRTYGNRVASITFEHSTPAGTESELDILNRALLRNNPSLLEGLDPIVLSYEKMLEAMLATPVPSSLTREHLAIINVYQALLNDTLAFQEVFTDALPAMTRFRRYQADVEALYTSLVMLYQKLHSQGIQWSEADAASRLISVE